MREYWDYPKIPEADGRDWHGCLLVNPLCPDDLCWLPIVGGKPHRLHCLGTDRWDHRFTLAGTAFYMSEISTTREDLISEGWQRQLALFPAEREFRRQVWGTIAVDEI